jgi:hypothetical protein
MIQAYALDLAISNSREDIFCFVGIQILWENKFESSERGVVVFDMSGRAESHAFRGIGACEIGVNCRAC